MDKNNDFEIEKFTTGIENRFDAEDIKKDAAQDESNWITVDGNIQLIRGRQVDGNESLTSGSISKYHIAYTASGTAVKFRQTPTTFEYLLAGIWTTITIKTASGTGTLHAGGAYTFQNYQNSLFNTVIISGPNARYVVLVGAPDFALDYSAVEGNDNAIQPLGYLLIDKGRGFQWGVSTDPTGFYMSWQDVGVATGTTQTLNTLNVAANGVQTVFSGTLSPAPTNLNPVVALTVTTSAVSTTNGKDDLNGNIVGTNITSGTINYLTGAYTVTFTIAPPVGNVVFKWYNYNFAKKGVFDFSKSATRLAGEGDVFRHDVGGDPIKQVVIGIDGNYFSLKEVNTYKVTLNSTDDTKNTSELFRKDVGVQTLYGAVSTSDGIYLVNTSNTNNAEFILLEKNVLGGDVYVTNKMPQFNFSKYSFDLIQLETWDRYVIICCKSISSLTYNDTMILVDFRRNIVDIVNTQTNFIYKDKTNLYSCSPFSVNTYQLFSGFTVDDDVISNYWTGKNETYDFEKLKKDKRIMLRGKISVGQKLQVYLIADNANPLLIGTILGTGSYVDGSSGGSAGYSGIGEEGVGGGGSSITIFNYLTQLKVKIPKYRMRAIKFVATGTGFISVEGLLSRDILVSEARIPRNYRVKEYVSKDGTQTNLYPYQV